MNNSLIEEIKKHFGLHDRTTFEFDSKKFNLSKGVTEWKYYVQVAFDQGFILELTDTFKYNIKIKLLNLYLRKFVVFVETPLENKPFVTLGNNPLFKQDDEKDSLIDHFREYLGVTKEEIGFVHQWVRKQSDLSIVTTYNLYLSPTYAQKHKGFTIPNKPFDYPMEIKCLSSSRLYQVTFVIPYRKPEEMKAKREEEEKFRTYVIEHPLPCTRENMRILVGEIKHKISKLEKMLED